MKRLIRLLVAPALSVLAASCSFDFGSLQGGASDTGVVGMGGTGGQVATTTSDAGVAGAGGGGIGRDAGVPDVPMGGSGGGAGGIGGRGTGISGSGGRGGFGGGAVISGGAGGAGGAGGSTGKVTATVAEGQNLAMSLRQDTTTLYWLVQESGHLKIRKAAKSGATWSNLADLGTFTSAQTPSMTVAADALYVAEGGNVYRVPLAGGAPISFASTTGADFGGGIGIASSTLFWLSPPSTVWSQALSAGTMKPISTTESSARELVTTSTEVYWSSANGLVVYDVGTGATSVFTPPDAYTGFANLSATVGTVVFLAGSFDFFTAIGWTLSGSGTLSSVPVQGSLLHAVAFDGASTIIAAAEAQGDYESTGVYVYDMVQNTLSYARATGGNDTVGGVASEIQVDATNYYLIVQNLILRRSR